MKTIRKSVIYSLFLLILLLLGSTSASAARKNEWFTNKKGVVFYYNEKGKRATGKTVIKKKTYYFDEHGRQLVGWQKIGSEYYYFAIRKGYKGSMVKNKTINGIQLNAKGVANRKTSKNLRKLKVMVAANKTVQSLTGYSLTMEKRTKLRKCFDYTTRKYYCCNIGPFKRTATWDIDYAERVIIPTDPRLRADCYTYGCAMAYLANACGAKAVAVSSGGHGWCDVDGYVCDPNWSRVDKAHNYFMRSYKLYESGTPAYRSNRYYTINI